MLLTNQSFTIFSASDSDDLDDWYVVNDGVMGGLSEGHIAQHEEGYLKFFGTVRLENNGGFTSIRYETDAKPSNYNAFKIRLKGDQKAYQFRVKSNKNEWYSYKYEMKTNSDWQDIIISFDQMIPTFRGRTLDQPNYQGDALSEITFLIGNKKKESFELLIDSVELIHFQ